MQRYLYIVGVALSSITALVVFGYSLFIIATSSVSSNPWSNLSVVLGVMGAVLNTVIYIPLLSAYILLIKHNTRGTKLAAILCLSIATIAQVFIIIWLDPLGFGNNGVPFLIFFMLIPCCIVSATSAIYEITQLKNERTI